MTSGRGGLEVDTTEPRSTDPGTSEDPRAPAPDEASSDQVAEARWRALGTGVHLLVRGDDLAPARAVVETILDDVDRTYSRFRPDSELMLVQSQAGRQVQISPLLVQAVDAALRAAQVTGGLVDPTVGAAVRALGYDADFDVVARRGNRDQPLEIRLQAVPGWQAVRLNRVARTLRIPPGVELDLGSTGKALAADLAATAALAVLRPGSGVLVSLGGDVAMAGTAPAGGWHVLATDSSETDPALGDRAGEVVALAAGGIATSSTTVRRWARGDVTVHHLVDPRTGGPADGPWRTVTVAAGTCLQANIAATAAIILGEDAPGWLEREQLPSRLVAHDGSVARVAGWPAPLELDEPRGHPRPSLEPAGRP